MHEPTNLLTTAVMNDAVVRVEGGSARIFWGEIPIGGKIQLKGTRCRRWRHDWYIDEYPRMNDRVYRDKVCRVCERRIPLT